MNAGSLFGSTGQLRVIAMLGLLTTFALSSADAGTFEADNGREVRAIRHKIRASQFLSKATFGATKEQIDDLAERIGQVGYRRACGRWIDQQFGLPSSSHEDLAREMVAANGREPNQSGIGINAYRYQAWWHIALAREDQLRQKVAWALSQIFVISHTGQAFNSETAPGIGNNETAIPYWLGMSDYYDMLVRNADGNYRDLLGEVTMHPCMGVYLSSWRNRKANIPAGRWPDENYAREIMQLFSVGLYELRQDGRLKLDENGESIPTYDNHGITEVARVFTGFKQFHNTDTRFHGRRNYGHPMVMHHQEHDDNYNYQEDPSNPGEPDTNAPKSKTIFGVTLQPLPSNLTNRAAMDEVNEALDVIANHPNVAPFICRLLIQRLVKSNPSRAYTRRVTRVFRDNGSGQRGDLQAVVKAVLLDPEAVRGQRLVRRRDPLRVEVVTRGTEHSRLKEPIQRVTSWIRAMRPTAEIRGGTTHLDSVTGQPYMMLTHNIESDLGQMPFKAPSVFNFYLQDYQPPGDLIGHVPSRRIPREALFAPEFQVMTALTANRLMNRFMVFSRNRYVEYRTRSEGDNEARWCKISFNLDEELELAKDVANLPEILRRFDLLLCNGSLSEQTKAGILDAVTSETTSPSQNHAILQALLCAVVLSPDCAIEQ
ncbi:MAG: DUF1800 family protein [Rubripirellula sp.]|nr:DUF1800 family protein [Rubripirellula sp.]